MKTLNIIVSILVLSGLFYSCDENEFAPGISDQSFSIDENPTQGQVIGQVIAADADTHQDLTFSIVSGNEGNYVRIEPQTGTLSVVDSTVFDFETHPQLSIVVVVIDSHLDSKTSSASITINLNDVLEIIPIELWEQLQNLPGDERQDAFSFAIGDLLVMGTGNLKFGTAEDVWVYDTKTEIWTQKADFIGGTRLGLAVFVINGKGYAGLGYDYRNGEHVYYKDFYSYDAERDIWHAIAEFKGEGGQERGTFTLNGKAYVLDRAGFQYFDTWEYDPSENIWTKRASCPARGVGRMVTFEIDGRGYACTGWNGARDSDELWEYDPIEDTWTEKSAFPGGPRSDAIGFSINGKGYVCAGTNYDGDNYYGPINSMYAYSAETDSWSQVKDFPGIYTLAMFCTTINGKAYVGTGYANGEGLTTEFWSYSPGE